MLEHRYYGDSQPYADWSTENMVHLSSEQALADMAVFLTDMGAGLTKQTVVVGGSYPGALSAWFRNLYPQIAIASWASSGVVEPIVDFWPFDNQVYLSSVKSGEACPLAIQKTVAYVTEQGYLRDDGDTDTVIDQFLDNTASQGMRTDDFMFYYADIFVESVQYGNRTTLCDQLATLEGQTDKYIFEEMTAFGSAVPGVNPEDYDTNILSSTVIDVNASGRPWTYQYCTEYGFF